MLIEALHWIGVILILVVPAILIGWVLIRAVRSVDDPHVHSEIANDIARAILDEQEKREKRH